MNHPQSELRNPQSKMGRSDLAQPGSGDQDQKRRADKRHPFDNSPRAILSLLSLAIIAGLTLFPAAITSALSLSNGPAQEPTPTPPMPTWTPGAPPTKTPELLPTETPSPTSTPVPPPPPKLTGGFIRLRVQFDLSSPWNIPLWQELWTVVQWQDIKGEWNDVEGWRGTLDTIAVSGDQELVGEKVWWVAGADLGKGPFRWLVYVSKGGDLLVISESFYLPDSTGETVLVEALLDKEQSTDATTLNQKSPFAHAPPAPASPGATLRCHAAPDRQ